MRSEKPRRPTNFSLKPFKHPRKGRSAKRAQVQLRALSNKSKSTTQVLNPKRKFFSPSLAHQENINLYDVSVASEGRRLSGPLTSGIRVLIGFSAGIVFGVVFVAAAAAAAAASAGVR